MEEIREIPSYLIEEWEKEAMSQRLPYTEFKEYFRMKSESYWQNQSTTDDHKEIFANAARNKLNEYGQRVALETLLAIPEVERTCKFARFDFEEMQKKVSQGFVSVEQKEMFESMRELWFSHLKQRMKDLRISKEMLSEYGIDWKVYKSFAYQQI